jgi:hypothetical protein
MKDNLIEAPVVTIKDKKTIIIHSHINFKGKMVLNKEEAMLIWLELHKFIFPEDDSNRL